MKHTTISIDIRLGARSIDRRTVSLPAELSIGRAPDNSIVLSAKDVSRHHGVLTITDDKIVFTSLSAAARTLQGGHKESCVAFGKWMSIGMYALKVEIDTADDTRRPDNIRKASLDTLVERMGIEVLASSDTGLGPRVEGMLDRILFDYGMSDKAQRHGLRDELRDEAIGLGPLEPLLQDPSVSEIMVVTPDAIWVEKRGRLEKSDRMFSDENSVRTIIDRIISPLGRRIDESCPMVDARLSDGSRVNAVIPPLALKGACLTIRKFSDTPFTFDDLLRFGTLSEEMVQFLRDAVVSRQNIVVSGGTGSGKTTLLNVLSSAISSEERIVTIEDAAELTLSQPHVVALESKPANAEGKGMVTIRDLVRNSLRMRPDRIVVGECRGGEALDMLQAMNTGHDGSLTTTHANSPQEAVSRLETLCLMSGVTLPSRAIRQQIGGAVHLIVQVNRFADGARRIVAISEVSGVDEDGQVVVTPVFYHRDGRFRRSGWMPAFQKERTMSCG